MSLMWSWVRSLVACQVEVPPGGSVEMSTAPVAEFATAQNLLVGHDTAVIALPSSADCDQRGRAANGLVDVRTSPAASPTTHSVRVGQATACRGWSDRDVARQADGPPARSCDASAWPPESIARHAPPAAHEMPVSRSEPVIGFVVHVAALVLGSLVVVTSPRMSTPTHSVVDGQASSRGMTYVCGNRGPGTHAVAPAVGLVLVSSPSPPSSDTHSVVLAQETA
jgi:hypothetical protein